MAMGKMLDTPECDQVDMYPEFSCCRQAGKDASTRHGAQSILRRARLSGCSKSALIIMHQHQASHCQRDLNRCPERESPSLFNGFRPQNEGKTGKRDGGYPGPANEADGDKG